jgi:hypothetical protein
MGTVGVARSDGPGQRIHDVADPASGRVDSFPVPGALSASTRAARIRALGYGATASIFATASHRLSPQAPYQASPKAWVDAFVDGSEGTWGTGPGVDQVWWRLPAAFPTEFMSGVNLSFQGVGQGARLVSLTVQTWPYSGLTGTVVIDIGALRTEIPVSVAAEHVIDIAFAHGGGFMDARIFWRPGMIDFVWKRGAMRRGLTAPA